MTLKTNEDFINTYQDVLRFPEVRIYSEEASTLSQMFTVIRLELVYSEDEISRRRTMADVQYKLGPRVQQNHPRKF